MRVCNTGNCFWGMGWTRERERECSCLGLIGAWCVHAAVDVGQLVARAGL